MSDNGRWVRPLGMAAAGEFQVSITDTVLLLADNRIQAAQAGWVNVLGNPSTNTTTPLDRRWSPSRRRGF